MATTEQENELYDLIISNVKSRFSNSFNFTRDRIQLAEFWDYEEDNVKCETILNSFVLDNPKEFCFHDFQKLSTTLYNDNRSSQIYKLFFRQIYHDQELAHFYPTRYWFENGNLRQNSHRRNEIIWENPSIEGSQLKFTYVPGEARCKVVCDRSMIVELLNYDRRDLLLSFYMKFEASNKNDLFYFPDSLDNSSQKIKILTENENIHAFFSEYTYASEERTSFLIQIQGNFRINYSEISQDYQSLEFMVWDGTDFRSIIVENESARSQFTIDEFTLQLFFDAAVLEKYRTHSIIEYDASGFVGLGSYWGSFRGGSPLGLSYYQINLGDFVEGIHRIEWDHWKDNSVQLENEEIEVLRYVTSFERRMKRLQFLRSNINSLLFSRFSFNVFQDFGEADKLYFNQLSVQISKRAQNFILQDKIGWIWSLFVDRLEQRDIDRFLRSNDPNLLKKARGQDGGPNIRLGNLIVLLDLLKLHIENGCEDYEEHGKDQLLYNKGFLPNEPECYLEYEYDRIYELVSIYFWLSETRHIGAGHRLDTPTEQFNRCVERYETRYDDFGDSLPKLFSYIIDDISELLEYFFTIILFLQSQGEENDN